MCDLIETFDVSSDGIVSSNDIAAIVERHLGGFHAYGYALCRKNHCIAVSADFPLETLCTSLSEIQVLDFVRLWATVDGEPLEQLQSDRLEVYYDTEDPHPSKIFNRDSSSWFRNLIIEKVDIDRYHCTYVGSANFAEVTI